MYFRTKHKSHTNLYIDITNDCTPFNLIKRFLLLVLFYSNDVDFYYDYLKLYNNSLGNDYITDIYCLNKVEIDYENLIKSKMSGFLEKLYDYHSCECDCACYSERMQMSIRCVVLFINRVKYGSAGGIPFIRVDGKGDTYEEDGVFCYS